MFRFEELSGSQSNNLQLIDSQSSLHMRPRAVFEYNGKCQKMI